VEVTRIQLRTGDPESVSILRMCTRFAFHVGLRFPSAFVFVVFILFYFIFILM